MTAYYSPPMLERRGLAQPEKDKRKREELRRIAEREARQVVDFDSFMKYKALLDKAERTDA